MSVSEPPARRWTVDEYHRAGEAGVFQPDERLELIEGAIICMSPQNGPHATAARLVELALGAVFTIGFDIRSQKPLSLSQETEPEPDIAVVRGQPRDYVESHPTTAVLVVEVSDTTLAYDRGRKSVLYARAGIPEYWVLNLPELLLEVYRDPDAAAGEYRVISRYSGGETVSPLGVPSAQIAISDLLP
jgi:Uma2 family endonuclease